MAVVCCDTSFLFSLYGRDTHTSEALAEAHRLGQAITLTVLNEFELLNTVRFAVFRRVLSTADATIIVAAFEADLASGFLVIAPANLAHIVAEANRLSATHTPGGGHRSFDLLHVAAASRIGATAFPTFDRNQRILAASMHMRLGP